MPRAPRVEDAHHPDVVLVGDLAGGVAGLAAVVMGTPAGRQRALLDERLTRAEDLGDAPDEVVAEIDRMTEDVGADPMTCLIDEEPPRQQPHRVAAVHREEAAVVVGDLPNRAVVDQLLGELHQGCPAVVVADARDHPRSARCSFGGHGLCRRATDRLLTEHGLARGRDSLDHLDVEHVGGRDEHDVDIVGVDDLVPVGNGALVAERSHGVITACLDGVADHHQFGLVIAIEEVARCSPAATTVSLTHPSEADHTDPYRAHAVRPSFVVTGHRGSVAMPAHESRTQ